MFVLFPIENSKIDTHQTNGKIIVNKRAVTSVYTSQRRSMRGVCAHQMKIHGKIDYAQRNKHEIMEMNNTRKYLFYFYPLLFLYQGMDNEKETK